MLTSKERSRLRAQGNKLRPQVWIGKEGITEGTLVNLNNALQTRDLLKVKLQENCPTEKREAAKTIADKLEAEVVQIIGNTILLFRPIPEEE